MIKNKDFKLFTFIIILIPVLIIGCSDGNVIKRINGGGGSGTIITTSTISQTISEQSILQSAYVKSVLSTLYNPDSIAENGAIGRNKNGFSDVAAQRGAVFIILRGIAENNQNTIDKGIKAIEYGFQFQEADGHFSNGHGLTALEAISADAFFIQAVGHAALAVKQSPYNDVFSPRFNALSDEIGLSLNWLNQNKNELISQDNGVPNRLLFDANAFILNGIFLNRNDLIAIGKKFANAALDLQRDDGVFIENNGHDSSYQATSILNLEFLWLYTDDTQLKNRAYTSLNKAVEWEKTRINAETGEVSVEGNTRTGSCQELFLGECKMVSYPEVINALIYWYAIANDGNARILAYKAMNYALTYLV